MKIDCQTAQRLFDDLSGNRLDKSVAQQVHQHLNDCTDCRVQQQRTARLLRLLALKRYEQPSPAFTANVVANFHRRLAAEESRGTAWSRLLTAVGLDSFVLPRYGWAGACALVLMGGMCWVGLRNYSETLVAARTQHAQSFALTSQPVVALFPVSSGELVPLPVPVSDDAAMTPTLLGEDLVSLVAAGHTQPSPPRYVLDRIAIPPPSDETARADF